MLGLLVFLGSLLVAQLVWALICAAVLRSTGRTVTLQLGLGPVAAAWQPIPGLEIRLGPFPIGAWVQGEPPSDAIGWVGAAVHAGMAGLAGVALWVAGGPPEAAVDWFATVLRFGHPETGGVLRTVLHASPWIARHPGRAVALVVFALAAWNTLHGALTRLAHDRLALVLLTVLGPLPWLLWLLWLDVVG